MATDTTNDAGVDQPATVRYLNRADMEDQLDRRARQSSFADDFPAVGEFAARVGDLARDVTRDLFAHAGQSPKTVALRVQDAHITRVPDGEAVEITVDINISMKPFKAAK